jgi:hypothetical protein
MLVLSPMAKAGVVTPEDQRGVGEVAGVGDRHGKRWPTTEVAAACGMGGRWIPGYEPFIILSPLRTAQTHSYSSPLAVATVVAADLETKAVN